MSCREIGILAFDPSISLTGWAATAESQLLGAGLIRTSSGEADDRARSIYEDVRKTCAMFPKAEAVIVEMPAAAGFGGGLKNRSPIYLPMYGVAVGVVFAAALSAVRCPVIGVSPNKWTKQMSAPSSKGDVHKEKRVRLVEQLYRLSPGALGARTTAGNVADAVLLSRWGRWEMQSRGAHRALGARSTDGQ